MSRREDVKGTAAVRRPDLTRPPRIQRLAPQRVVKRPRAARGDATPRRLVAAAPRRRFARAGGRHAAPRSSLAVRSLTLALVLSPPGLEWDLIWLELEENDESTRAVRL